MLALVVHRQRASGKNSSTIQSCQFESDFLTKLAAILFKIEFCVMMIKSIAHENLLIYRRHFLLVVNILCEIMYITRLDSSVICL